MCVEIVIELYPRVSDLEMRGKPKYPIIRRQKAAFDQVIDVVDVVVQLPDRASGKEYERAEDIRKCHFRIVYYIIG